MLLKLSLIFLYFYSVVFADKETTVHDIATELTEEFIHLNSSTDSLLKDAHDVIRRVFWISNNMFSTSEQKLQDIRALMLPASQVPAYLKLFDMNMKWSFRLIKPDIPKEIREIEHVIRQLKVSQDMLELDKEYVLNKLKRMLREFSEPSLTRYIQLKHEFSGGTSEEFHYAEDHHAEVGTESDLDGKLIYRDKLIKCKHF
ncbi:hypothetical protein WR25_16925 [Diploscapter pachys]|uniref:Prolyl 4-hydroxylase alpha-subunit N-terminal domain-containing protein n=1 Tax=Diploscapter pachys TaxID=2018661 RepID=A0A2A2JPC1_9BILA|nr:hypothetical protein WR25_16925 [Diploscapter pachys]